MKIILLYGPPASGKLTVGTELAKKLGDFVILHNHRTIDLYKEVMEFGTDEFWSKVSTLRFELIELAAKNDKNLIMTFCYEPGDEPYIEKIEKIANRYGTEIYYVGLECSEDELRKRVLGESRRAHGKIKTLEEINDALERNDYSKKIDGKYATEINNTEIRPEEVAEMIISKFHLR